MDFEKNFGMVIDGKIQQGTATFDVLNPATKELIAQVPDATAQDLDAAIAAARKAFPSWAATPIEERKAKMKALGDAVFANSEPLMKLLTREQGKPLSEAQGEVMGSGYWLQAYTSLDLPVTVNEDSAERYSETRHVPLGVVGAIAPWNYPLFLAMFKVAPALLAGNTMVLKPSPFTPLTTLKFAELASQILPPGVLNVVTGGDSLGPLMTSHPGFDKISFTGSTATGRRVMASAAPTLKRVTLELGGNDAAIVMPDVDVKEMAVKLFWASFTNNGQVCIATKRVYVHADIYDALRDALYEYAKTIKVGDGSQADTQVGPMNNEPQFRRVLELIADSKDKGYKVLTCNADTKLPGYFMPITLIDNPPEDSRIVQEEQFGPVLPLIKFSDYDAVIAQVNGTEFGLAGSVWGKDEQKAMALAQRIDSGTVWVNSGQHLSPLAAFGGMKQSGVGVEGGLHGLLEYTNAQTIVRGKAPAAA
jgi:aldehyde dehydrogenase (NAD+)